MPVPSILQSCLKIPIIGAPMTPAGTPALTIAQCTSGIIGAFPALNARRDAALDSWLSEIEAGLTEFAARNPSSSVAPYAVNIIVHKTNPRIEQDLKVCVAHHVPIVITSLGARAEIIGAVHAYGGLVFHDVMTIRHMEKALEQGVDGLVLLCAGGGGHSGYLSPFAFVTEVRRSFQGPIAVSGAITNGRGIASVRALGADFAYIGTRFVASTEAGVPDRYKQMILDSTAADIVYTDAVNGVKANFLKASLIAAGFDMEELQYQSKGQKDYSKPVPKAWREIWSAGEGVGNIDEIRSASEIIERLGLEYQAALTALAAERC